MNPLIECLGWTLVHFLWQGLAIALLLAIGLGLLRQGPPNHRYLAGCAALLLMVVAPGITFYFVEQRLQPSPVPAVEPASSAPDSIESKLHPANPGPKVIFTARPVTGRPSFTERLEMLLPWLVVGWSVGVLALSCRLLAGWLQVRRMQCRAIETLAEPWHLKLAELAQRLSISRPVRLFKSAMVEVPTVIGWLRPVILLPASCLVGLTPKQLESILAHELAHIRRHDYLVNLLQSMVETLLFYHPAVWWVSRCVREERENCCDDIAVKICGDPVAYARALATLEEMRPASAQLALAASGAPLLQRIQRLLGKSSGTTNSPTWPLAGVFIAIMIMALATNLRGGHAVAADSLTPEMFLTGLGVYHYTNNNSILELTIRSNQLLLASSSDSIHNSAGVNTWNPGSHWFLYVAKGRHVWAYDGNSGLWLLRADPLTGSGSASIEWLRERPPVAVVKRLPKAVIQMLPPPLESRKYHLNPERFMKALEEAGFSARDIKFNDDSKSASGGQVNDGDSKRRSMRLHLEIRQFFTSHGVDFPYDTLLNDQNHLADTNAPTYGKTIYYNERTGMLLVRATSQDLDKLTTVLAAINDGKKPNTNVGTDSGKTNGRYSAIPDTEKTAGMQTFRANEVRIATIVQEGKILFEAGKLDEAEEMFNRVCQEEPRNVAAHQYLQLIKQFRLADDSRTNLAIKRPHVSKGRQAILSKLDRIRLDSVKYDDLPLVEVINNLAEQARLLDPDRVGINFFIDRDSASTNMIDQKNGLSVNIGAAKIRINHALTNISLGNLLAAIVKTADKPIKYSILDYAVVFSPRGPETVPLETRKFHLDTGKFLKALENAGFSAHEVGTNFSSDASGGLNRVSGDSNPRGKQMQMAMMAIRKYFKSRGVGFGTNYAAGDKAIYFNDRKGILLVRATAHDLEIIQAALDRMDVGTVGAQSGRQADDNGGKNPAPAAVSTNSISSPISAKDESRPQIDIKVKFVEIDEAASKTSGFDWIWKGSLGNFATNRTEALPKSMSAHPITVNSNVLINRTMSNSIVVQGSGILTGPQFRAAITTLKQRKGVEFLTAPEVTTESGRQAQIMMLDIVPVVTGTNAKQNVKGTADNLYKTEMVGLGPILDVNPRVSDDGNSIDMKLIASVTEFLGNAKAKVPTALLRERQLTGDVTALDGQTVVLFGMETAPDKKSKRSTIKPPKKLLVFVTPTLINPDGSRYHAGEASDEKRFSDPSPQPSADSAAAKKIN